MNEPERLFFRFCESRGWRVERIDSHASPEGEKAADFRMVLAEGAVEVTVEVKHFEPNQEEMEGGVQGGVPGERIRRKISRANKQLKASSRDGPAMLVLHDLSGNHTNTHSYAVLTAMQGLDVITYFVPKDPIEPLVRGPMRPGPRRKLTADRNTSISCIAVMREFWPESAQETGIPEYALAVYHNQFAVNPLDPSHLVGRHVTHYRMSKDQEGWEPCGEDQRGPSLEKPSIERVHGIYEIYADTWFDIVGVYQHGDSAVWYPLATSSSETKAREEYQAGPWAKRFAHLPVTKIDVRTP